MATSIRKEPQSVDDRLHWLAPHADGFKTWLHDKGYRAVTIVETVRLLACWAEWVRVAGFDFDGIESGFTASAAVFRGGKTARAPQGAAALFVRCLREQAVVPTPERSRSAEETWPLLSAFRSWMHEQRGVANSTLDAYQWTLVDLLTALGDNPGAYTALAVRTFVLERAKPHGRGRAQGSRSPRVPSCDS